MKLQKRHTSNIAGVKQEQNHDFVVFLAKTALLSFDI